VKAQALRSKHDAMVQAQAGVSRFFFSRRVRVEETSEVDGFLLLFFAEVMVSYGDRLVGDTLIQYERVTQLKARASWSVVCTKGTSTHHSTVPSLLSSLKSLCL
jgi:hypothetical protein